jgi:hypothetical protein
MSIVLARKLSPEDALRVISAHITTRLRGGPNRKAEDVELARKSGLPVEPVMARWGATEAKRPAWMRRLDGLTQDWAAWLVEGLEIICEGLASIDDVSAVAEAQGWPADEGQLPASVEAKAYFQAATAEEVTERFASEASPEQIDNRSDEPTATALPVPKAADTPATQLATELVSSKPAELMSAFEAGPLRNMDDKHAIISNYGGNCMVMEWAPSHTSPGVKELVFQSITAFKDRYANKYVTVPAAMGLTEQVLVARRTGSN